MTISELQKSIDQAWDDHRDEHRDINNVISRSVIDLAEIKTTVEFIKPKPIDKLKVISLIVGFITTVFTAAWVLSAKVQERPTLSEINKLLSEHADDPIQSMRHEMEQQNEILRQMRDDLRAVRNSHR